MFSPYLLHCLWHHVKVIKSVRILIDEYLRIIGDEHEFLRNSGSLMQECALNKLEFDIF